MTKEASNIKNNTKKNTTFETMGDTIEIDPKDGIPLKHVGFPDQMSVASFYAIGNILFGAIGFAVAWFLAYYNPIIIRHGSLSVDARIELLTQHDLGWLYLGIFLLKLLQVPFSIVLGEARKTSKVAVPDQQVYKVMGSSDGSKHNELGYVLMEKDGVHGAFNRAQRALQNYHEVFPTLALQYVAASWVFPFEAFVCVMVWAVTRVLGAIGYKTKADDRFRGIMPGLVALSTIQGMILIAAFRALTLTAAQVE